MLAGIRDILIITTPHDQEQFIRLLGDGSDLGLNLTYAVQPEPNGLAEAFIIGADHVGADTVALVLGDNIFYGHGLGAAADRAPPTLERAACCSATRCSDPERYGVAEADADGRLDLDRGEAGRAEVEPGRHRAVLLRQRRRRDRRRPGARRRAASWRSPT